MPYAPGVQYHGDEYLYKGITDAAAHVSDALAEVKKKRDEVQGSDAVADYLAKEHPDVMTPEVLQKYTTGGLSAKKSILGEVSVDLLRKFQDTERQQQMGLERERMAQTANFEQQKLDRETMTPAALAKFEKDTGHTVFNGQVVPLKGAQNATPSAMDVEGGEVIDLGNGKRVFKAKPVPKAAGKSATGLPVSDARTQRMGEIEQRMAEIETEAAKGADPKGRDGWYNWWGKTRNQEYDALAGERTKLQESLKGRPPSGQATTAASGGMGLPEDLPQAGAGNGTQFKSAEEVRAAFAAGKIDQETAAGVLQKQFGYQ